ncbi:MAG: thiamine pyrophosphate-binding protein [Opitutaceae bacterium]|nr:thiamine pyrophosphate-binding protein [Opitutaceae bacterium]
MNPGPGTAKLTGAEAIVAVLSLLEVKRVFGIPGVQTIELFDALADAPFRTFTPTNESAAVFMADAHARVTGRIGVAVVTAGPGLTNALTGIAEAFLDSSPILVLVGTSDERAEKSFQLHHIDQAAVVKPLVKGFFKPATVQETPASILQAAELARQGEPGPTVVEISASLLMERARFEAPPQSSSPCTLDIESQLDESATLLRQGTSIGIYAGAGSFGAAAELQCLAELLQAPVATTISGRGILPEDHPLSVGYGFGRSGTAVAWREFRRVRTLLAVGCKYGETATGSYGLNPPAEHIHIDINAASLGANYPTSLAIAADAKTALGGLLARLQDHRRPPNVALLDRIRQSRARTVATPRAGGADALHPGRFLQLLRQRLRRDAILVTDSGAHQFWALSDFPIYEPRSFLAPADYQAMGFSLPAAIAAKLACPNRQVVSLVGDGGFLMSGFESLNAARWGAGIITVVFCDGAWGLIKEAQRRVYRRTPFTRIPNPDFHHLALGLGLKHLQVSRDAEIPAVLDAALSENSPVLIEVQVDYAEPPPYIRGAGPQMFRNLSPKLQAGIALRLARRWISPPRPPST